MIRCMWKDRDNRTRIININDKYAALADKNYINNFIEEACTLYGNLCKVFEERYSEEVIELLSIDGCSCNLIVQLLNELSERGYWTTDLTYLRKGK